jgi:hypothetical protein
MEHSYIELAQATTASAQLQQRYAKERDANLALKAQFEVAQQVGPTVFILNQTRGDNAPERPANKISIPQAPRWVVLILELDLSEFRSYRATLQDHEGNAIWQKDNVVPNSLGAIGLSFPSTLLRPGDYVLSLEGIARKTIPSAPTLIADPEAGLARAESLWASGDYDQAERLLTGILQRNPDLPAARMLLQKVRAARRLDKQSSSTGNTNRGERFIPVAKYSFRAVQ